MNPTQAVRQEHGMAPADWMRELRIALCLREIEAAADHITRARVWRRMRAEIRARSPAAVAYITRERGLA